MHKIIDFLESSVALLALISIVTISSAVVLSLNPNPYDTIKDLPSVEGIEYVKDESEIPLIIKMENEVGDLEYNEKSSEYIYTTTFTPVAPSRDNQDALKVYNNNKFDKKLKIHAQIYDGAANYTSIKFKDTIDTLILSNPQTGSIEREVTIPGNSNRLFTLFPDNVIPLNFPFKVRLTLK